ncbi:hypothetical protein ACFWP7_36090 [Streptomyces sp. NPDC058470]|uniref:hypothetical protein n=1 Tax=Streptomyces sp. NPDC058470 TaxID=3346515 RepID=UPI00365E6AAF
MATAFLAAVFLAEAFLAAVSETAGFEAVDFEADLLGAAVFEGAAAEVAAALPDAAFPVAASDASDARDALDAAFAALPEAFFTGLEAVVPPSAGAPCALFFPLTSLAAGPVDLPDADCCTAVFFATMAAAPSHIVILLANRAGTINRLPTRGNAAHQQFARPAGPARQAFKRCAQLPAR